MTTSPRNSNKPWTKKDESQLASLAKRNIPTLTISSQLGRSKDAIYSKASDLGVSLKPKDK
jgi:hypothetical protein